MYFFYYVPIGLDLPLRRFPAMTVAYSVICTAVFCLVRFFPEALPLDYYNMIYTPGDGILTAISAAFLHFGYAHLIGNLVYLTFFGCYVEDRLGPVLFTVVFLSSAAIGNILQGVFNVSVLHHLYLGIIGASGAVSGLLGVFSVRFLTSKIRIAYWVFFPLQGYTRGGRIEMAAVLAVLIWFLLQVVRGLVQGSEGDVQVAYVTHLSAFAWGIALAFATGQYRHGRVDAMARKGNRYMTKGEPYAAQGAFIRYLTHRPDAAPVYASLARAMVMSGNVQGALKNYRHACHLWLDQGQRGESEALYQEALRGYPDFAIDLKHQLNLAFGLERNLKPEVAVKAYENFENTYPTHEEAPFALLRAAGLYRETLSNIEEADACYRRLVERYPEDRWVDFARDQLCKLQYERPAMT